MDSVEIHEPAFELIHQRTDGWYGVQDNENVHPGDEVELLIGADWRSGTVDHLDALGFFVHSAELGVEMEYRTFATERVLWRWPGRHDESWVGPFLSPEAAETVRHEWAPGYLVCGVCGWDGWKTRIAERYRLHHGPPSEREILSADEVRRPPQRRLLA